jgi:DNA-binding NarL/FixJ family response regulator
MLQSVRPTIANLFLTVSEDSQQKTEMLRFGRGHSPANGAPRPSSERRLYESAKTCPPQPGKPSASGSNAPLSAAEAEQRVMQLTQRERQLIPLVCSGLKNKEIAQQLGIAESTVWHHLTAVFTKLKVEDRLGLAAFAFSHRPALAAARSHPASGPRVVKLFPPGGLHIHKRRTTDWGPGPLKGCEKSR